MTMKSRESSEERPKMNVKLLRRIQKHISAEPRRFNMHFWGKHYSQYVNLHYSNVPPCRTAGCIAGTACILTGDIQPKKLKGIKALLNGDYGYIDFPLSTPFRARRALGLTKEQADRLFLLSTMSRSGNSWPDNFELRFNAATTSRQRAKVAVARIDHFIKTKGAE